MAGSSRKLKYWRLLQGPIDRGELLVEVSTNAVDHSDDGQRNAGSDQAVFNGGGARLIVQETRKKFRHVYPW